LGLGGRFAEQVEKELMGWNALAPRGFKQTAPDAMVSQIVVGAGAVDDFVHDHHRSQASFGLVVAGWHLDQIVSLKLGCNTKSDRVKFAIKDVRWIKE
jgi:hypothetical protein